MSGWWDSITSGAQLLVDEISAQANEATNDMVKEQVKLRREEEARHAKALESLPWETDDESKSIISQALMTDILQLALSERNFTEPPPPKIKECCNFDLQLYISQAMRLLSLDQNLAHIHAKISPKMNEDVFWEHYFVRIYYLRCKSGLLDTDNAIVQAVASFPPEDVIFKAETSTAPSPVSKSHVVVENGQGSSTKMASQGSDSGASSSPKAKTWENSSSEDVCGSEMSMSSYEVVPTKGNGSSASDNEKSKSIENDDALFEAQLKAELDACELKGDDDDFEDLDDLDDLDDLGDDNDDDDDAELEAQIARELANEE
mmetsp:Transcript_13601/g.22421  ORF Transcript_13601/g.22421 Transcript_13601/m.22421 type:complete len:318 (-) Transcript_13601:1720-2673(-)